MGPERKGCLLLRVQFRLGACHTSNRVAVVAIVEVARVDVARIRAEVVHAVVTVASRTPEDAVATLIVRRPIVEAAGEGQG